MHPITVVALGPGSPDLMTLGALRRLKAAPRVLLRTARHGAAELLRQEGIPFDSLDGLYTRSPDYDDLAARAARRVLDLAEEGPLCYGVADPAQDETVRLLRREVPELAVLPGVAHSAFACADNPLPGPWRVCPASGLRLSDAQSPVCLTELDRRELAGECKLKLLSFFDPDSPVLFYPPGEEALRRPRAIPLEDLDRQPAYDHTVSALILPRPLLERSVFDLQDLIALMRRLRAPGGCPWDREQTHASLARYLVEEAFETLHAIHEEDWAHVQEELGDVLLQVIFHADVGAQYGTLDLCGITSAVCAKLIGRHRHVFGGQACATAEEVEERWEAVKAQERGRRALSQAMAEIPRGMSPLLRAMKVQEKASKAGFDWDRAEPALEKVTEEAGEVLDCLRQGRDPSEEVGDLFFACVNAARLMGVFPEEAVAAATEKFIRRFGWMEAMAENDGKTLQGLTLSQLDVYWERSKRESI